MVIVRLIGGLGNQLFQYAAGRAVSIKQRVPLKLDISGFDQYTNRWYYLDAFNISGSCISPILLSLLTKRNSSRGIYKSIAMLGDIFLRNNRIDEIKESSFEFQDELSHATGHVYLEGYWQSEKYFREIEDVIRDEYKLRKEPPEISRKTENQIQASNSVCIHFRRGDYITNPRTNKFHGVCSPEYYQRAIEYILSRQRDVRFFIFSDDMNWVRKNVLIDYPKFFVDHNSPEEPQEDLRLMSLFKHHIIANSTFSWWGAWLSDYENKTVVAPKKWFNEADRVTSDLIPDSWIRI